MLLDKVVLVKSISYKKNKKLICIPKGTEILVDTTSNVALIGKDHVDVQPNEYMTISFLH